METNQATHCEKRPSILMVDDVPKNLQLLGTILGKIECDIAAAMNGKQAIEIANEIHPDLILLDVMMPELDGFETCKRLKESDITKEIPIIFLTAKTETENVVNGFELGAVDYVTKPFISAELLARVRTHLELKQARDAQESLIQQLQDTLAQVRELRGLLPICSACKKVRDDNGYWHQVEHYIAHHSKASFTHGMCPECKQEYYGDYLDKKLAEVEAANKTSMQASQ